MWEQPFLYFNYYYFKHKGNICSGKPAREQTELNGWSAHQATGHIILMEKSHIIIAHVHPDSAACF